MAGYDQMNESLNREPPIEKLFTPTQSHGASSGTLFPQGWAKVTHRFFAELINYAFQILQTP